MKTLLIIGVIVLLVLLFIWYGGSGSSGSGSGSEKFCEAFSVGGAIHEVTSLPNQTLNLYNRVMPDSMRLKVAKKPSAIATKKQPAASMPRRSKFVGAQGRTPEMQHCLDFDDPSDKTYDFNRCDWV